MCNCGLYIAQKTIFICCVLSGNKHTQYVVISKGGVPGRGFCLLGRIGTPISPADYKKQQKRQRSEPLDLESADDVRRPQQTSKPTYSIS